MDGTPSGFGSGPVSGQASGQPIQPETPAAGGQPEQSQPVPEYVTRQDLAAFQDTLERRIQSMADKKDSQLKRAVEERLQQVEARYMQVGQKMPDDVRQGIINDTVLSFEDDGQPGQPAQAAGPSPELVAYVQKKAAGLLQRHGVPQITPQDPEYRLLNLTTPDPDEYLDGVEKAAAAYAERQRRNPNQTTATPAARAPILSGQATGGGTLLADYQREMQGIRPGTEQAMQIRRKYRGKGLDI